MKKQVSTFAQGEAAFKSGQAKIDNPYTFHSEDWLGWDSGWVTAQRKARKAIEAAQLAAIEARPLETWMKEPAQ